MITHTTDLERAQAAEIARLREEMSKMAQFGSPPAQPAPAQRLSNTRIIELWDAHIVPAYGKQGINPIVFARAIEDAIVPPGYVMVPGWQPIETAPSDVVLLLYTPHIHEANPERVEARVYHDSRAGSRHAWATHWMPLPPPPAAAKDTP